MKTVTQTELKRLMLSADIDPSAEPQFWDVYYAVTTLPWLRDVFGPAWSGYSERLMLASYPSLDCDDYAQLAWSYARFLHARNTEAKCGIAFGFYGYTRADNFEGHAINVVYTDGGLVWFEPQTGKVIGLPKEERQTCSFYAF